MELDQYIAQAANMTMRQIAQKAGLQQSKLTRQFNGTSALTMETLRDIARATGLDMLDLFTRADLITKSEAKAVREAGTLHGSTDEELAAEVLRRMQAGSTVLDEPIDTPKLSVLPRTVDTDADQYLAAKTDDQDDVREEDYPDA